MKNVITTFLLMLLLPTMVYAQGDDNLLSKKEIRKARPAYIGLGFGFNSASIRDFATSPLVYSGITSYSSFEKLRIDSERETSYGFTYTSGSVSNSFNDHIAESNLKIMAIHYSQLFKLNTLSSDKYNVKVGGLLNVAGNLRINGSLQNNAAGIEIIPTVFGSIKVTKDISRKEGKTKRFLFIKYKVKPRTRHLSFHLNVGLINGSFRNGYVYADQSAVLNEPSLFADHKLKMFSGFRINSALDYTITLANKNKVQLSYVWDAYKTGGSFDKLEVASHIFKLSFLFNTNNK